MRIAGHFYSTEGEGQKVGLPTFFLEFPGCTSKCPFCKFKSDGVVDMTQEQIVKLCDQYPTRHIYLDCGEPLLQGTKQIGDLLWGLVASGYEPTLQTNGYIYIGPLFPVSTKVTIFLFVRPGVTDLTNINRLRAEHDQIKFVVTTMAEYLDAIEIIKAHTPTVPVFIFPHPKYKNETELFTQFTLDYHKHSALSNTRMCLLEHLYAGVK